MAASAIPATAASRTTQVAVTLGRVVGDRLLAVLVDEARRQRPEGGGDLQVVGRAGDALARLAVSRQLAEVVSTAMGAPLGATYRAVYQYQSPGCAVRRHRDREGYDVVFHLTVEHATPADGSIGSVLVVDGEPDVALPPGHGVVLRGREVEHQWTPLAADEHRTLVAVGFTETEIT